MAVIDLTPFLPSYRLTSSRSEVKFSLFIRSFIFYDIVSSRTTSLCLLTLVSLLYLLLQHRLYFSRRWVVSPDYELMISSKQKKKFHRWSIIRLELSNYFLSLD